MEGQYNRGLPPLKYAPVFDSNNNSLMPTKEQRAIRWCESGKATPFYKRGIWCVRLNQEPSARKLQPIACGIDPGSKREGLTLKSQAHTYINIQATAVTWVSDAVKTCREMRRARRFRKTPCRKNRQNRARGGIPPSTKARWQWKMRLVNWLRSLYPITDYVVEDIQATTFRGRRWNKNFSPLQIGKEWFYGELEKLGTLYTRQGYETAQERELYGLKKSGNKLAAVFSAHCVDSWCLANWLTGGHINPDNEQMLLVTPLRFHRRQLHRFQPEKGGTRKPYGGTRSHGLKRGSLIKHAKWGIAYVGGILKDRISLHSVETGKRLCQNAKPTECKFLTYNSWRTCHAQP